MDVVHDHESTFNEVYDREQRIGNTNDLRQRSLRPWIPSP